MLNNVEIKSGRFRNKYECICDCGEVCYVLGESLTSGHTKTCGCGKGTKGKVKDITGERFGKLIVTKLSHIKSSAYWLCSCDCGNTTIVFGGNLKSGKTVTCGCGNKESILAKELKEYLKERYNAKTEYKILRNPKTNYFLPFDIFIESMNSNIGKNIFIEVHGEQHYQITGFEIRKSKLEKRLPEEILKERMNLDKIKKKYAEKNGIYIEIDIRISKDKNFWIKEIEKII